MAHEQLVTPVYRSCLLSPLTGIGRKGHCVSAHTKSYFDRLTQFSFSVHFISQVYVAKVDPTSSLGLSTDSIYSYSMGHIKRVLGGEAPETQPSRCMSRGPSGITVALKGLWRSVLVTVSHKIISDLRFTDLLTRIWKYTYILSNLNKAKDAFSLLSNQNLV